MKSKKESEVVSEFDLVATTYMFRSEHEGTSSFVVNFCRMNSPFYDGEKWAVRRSGCCLSKSGEWDYEPIPSSRTDSFYKKYRFKTLGDAIKVYKKTVEMV
jgi:hypothetical protein